MCARGVGCVLKGCKLDGRGQNFSTHYPEVRNSYILFSVSVVLTPSDSPTAGKTYSLECSVNGTSDNATFQWLEGPTDNRTQLTTDGSRTINSTSSVSQLQFSPLRASHGGQYTCQATVMGVVLERSANVVVDGKLYLPHLLTTKANCHLWDGCGRVGEHNERKHMREGARHNHTLTLVMSLYLAHIELRHTNSMTSHGPTSYCHYAAIHSYP